MEIKIEFSESALFGSADTDEIDVAASKARFIEALENHLEASYPDSEVEIIESINDRVQINGAYDHDEGPWIDQIIDIVYNGDDWPEYK